ncbi:MAG: NfeD family protein [Cyanobacteriota bacterium]|nr:NfeD family protein [Cyanobacteriota bacterium]
MTDIFDSSDSALETKRMDVENPDLHHDSRQFTGEAVVDEEIRPQQRGRVEFRSSWWFARCQQDIILAPGERVKVIGLLSDSLTLLVEPIAKTEPIPVEVVEVAVRGPDQPLSPT